MNTIIFDLDGLLIDSEIVSYRMYKSIVPSFTEDEYSKHYSGHTAMDNLKRIKKDYQLSLSLEEIDEKCRKFDELSIEKGIELKKGAEELLSYLKRNNFVVGLATSSDKTRAEKILKKNKLLQYFNSFTFGTEAKRSKPSPDIFLISSEKMGSLPSECLVFEDSEAGIFAANAAGIPVICIPDMKMPSQDALKLTKKILPNLLEAIEYIKKENAN